MSAPHHRLPPEVLRKLTGDVGPFLSCDDCFRLADQFADGLIAGEDEPIGALTAAMRSHLTGCPACSEEMTSLLLLAAQDLDIDPSAALLRAAPRPALPQKYGRPSS